MSLIINPFRFAAAAPLFSVDFNGSTQYATRASNAAFNVATLTAEADCYPDSALGRNAIISRFAVSNDMFTLKLVDGKLRFNVKLGGNWRSAVGSTTITTGTWYHFAGIYDGTNLKVYINGIEDGSTAYAGSIASVTAALEIGGTIATSGENFDGKITNARVWSVNRVASLGAAIDGSETGLVLAMDESGQPGSGSTWLDLSPNSFDVTLKNSPAWSTSVP